MLLALSTVSSPASGGPSKNSPCSDMSGNGLDEGSSTVAVRAEQLEVRVVFGEESTILPKAKLEQLPYFEARLTQRWSQEGSNSICVSNNNCSFGPNDLHLLLKCIELDHIPRDPVLSLKQLETLANCADFLCAGPNAFINKSKLLNYFEKRVPPLTVTQRQDWLVDCNNKLIRQALIDYSKILSKRLSSMRANFVNRNGHAGDTLHSHFESLVWDEENLTSISYDSDTAAALFRKKFKFVVTKQLVSADTVPVGGRGSSRRVCGVVLKLNIEGFNKAHFDHLYNLFDIKDYWHLFGKDLTNIVENLERWDDTHLFLCKTYKGPCKSLGTDTNEQNLCFHQMLSDAIKKPPHGVSAYSVLGSLINLAHCQLRSFADCFNFIGGHATNLTRTDEVGQVLKHFIWSHDYYVKNCKLPGDTPEVREKNEKNRKVCQSWHKCLQYLLSRCSKEFVVANASKWFGILHDMPKIFMKENHNEEKIVSFVFDNLICKFDTQSAFDFGLFLVDYLVYQKKIEMNTLPARYLEFLKQNVGIEWNVL